MKLDRTSYLELVVCHVDSTFDEYPSRFCVIRVPLARINDRDPYLITLSLGQVRKLLSIGYYNSPDLYYVVGHRPFDKNLIKNSVAFRKQFCNSAFASKEDYSDYL